MRCGVVKFVHHQRPNRIFCKPKATSLNLPLGQEASESEIKRAYKKLALKSRATQGSELGIFGKNPKLFGKGSRSVGSRWAGENMGKEALKVLIHDITLVIFTIVVDKLAMYKWFSMGHSMADL